MRIAAVPRLVTAPPAEEPAAVPLLVQQFSVDDVEIARRLVSLISLLGIYVLGLLLVALISEGPDIGVLLAAMLCHAVYVSVRWSVREQRRRAVVLTAQRRGVAVLGMRPRFIAYRDIKAASSTDEGLVLVLRRGGERVEVRWGQGPARERKVFLRKLYGRAGLVPSRRAPAPRESESVAQLKAALETRAPGASSTHLAAAG